MTTTVIFDMHQTIFKNVDQAQSVSGDNDPLHSIEPMPNAIEVFLSFYQQGYKIVIMSSADAQNSRQRLQFLLLQHGLSEEKVKQILKEIDILSMLFFGSKHTKEAWLEAMKPYKNIEYIFEDGEARLHAAGEAAKQLGHDPELYLSVSEFVDG